MILLAVARAVFYAAAMLLFGSAALGAVLGSRGIVAAPPCALRWLALIAAIAASVAWLALATAQMAGDPVAELTGALIVQAATTTLFGQAMLLRLAALAILAGILLLGNRPWTVALFCGIALVLPALTSHAAATGPAGFGFIGVTMDAVHLATGGFWIGGLALLAVLFGRREPRMLEALAAFSDWALVAVVLLVMTGMINAASILWGEAGHPAPLYLVVLGVKLALVAAMLSLAAINRLKLMPRRQVNFIARNAVAELALGLAVVALAGVLGQLQPTL